MERTRMTNCLAYYFYEKDSRYFNNIENLNCVESDLKASVVINEIL